MISFTIGTPEGKKRITAPSSWNEITYDQLCQRTLWNGTDIIKLFSILTGIPFEKAEGLTDPGIDETLYEICGFIFKNEPEWKNLRHPKQILWGEQIIKVPTNLRDETLAQSMMMGQVLRSEDTVMDAIPKAMAIYLQTKIKPETKPDNDIMLELSKQMMKRNAMEVYSIGNFFLSKLTRFNKNFRDLLLQKDRIRLKRLRERGNSTLSTT